ncbi:hypothetical protein RIF29_09090 [Crotalaria pallida]|uniref:phenylalanine--tRNA ligase n=1 Tax=Crotalaria pallida TaxID=3830 RepID=A0AAN9FRJ3_CROPI
MSSQKAFSPKKYFSIDRVFRNEPVDRTHLAEFHQIEGLVCDRGLTLCDLIGVLHDFFSRLGMTKLKFKPAYNPYTEPSMEIFSHRWPCMAKKWGRPPKTPSSSKSKASSESPGSQKLDFTQLDEEDLTEIDSLSPKQTERLLKNLDVLREKIKGKAILEEQQGEEQPLKTNRAIEEGLIEDNRVDGGGAVRLTTQPESFIEPSTTHQGESSACRLGVVKDKNISTASVRGGVEIDKDIGKGKVDGVAWDHFGFHCFLYDEKAGYEGIIAKIIDLKMNEHEEKQSEQLVTGLTLLEEK